jgi:transposase InsO family protein
MAVFFCHHGFILTKIISWSLDTSRTAEVTKPSMIGAIRKRQPEAGLMIYTDRGVEQIEVLSIAPSFQQSAALNSI